MLTINKIKVLYITNIPAPYTVDFYNELGKEVDLTVLFERCSAGNRQLEWFNEEICNFKHVYMKGRKFGKEMAICFEVRKYISPDFDFVIVGNYSSPTGMLAIKHLKAKNIPFFIHADGAFINKESKLKTWFKRRLVSSAKGYFSSGNMTDTYFRYYGKSDALLFKYPFTSVREKDIRIEIENHSKKKERRDKAFYKEEYIILFVGSLINRKGIDILIKAAQYLPKSVGIYMIGGERTKEINDLIGTETNVHIHPFVEPDKVKFYMQDSDLFVFPTRGDVWGLVVNEAMSQGLPVITSDKCVAGLELIRDGENGLIINSENPEEWAQNILQLINNPDKLFDMSKKCLETIKPYTIENMAKQYINHIREYLKNNE